MGHSYIVSAIVLLLIGIGSSSSQTLAAGGLTTQQLGYVNSVAAGGSGAGWTGLTNAQEVALAGKADDYLHDYQTYHLPNGLNADVWFTNFSRTTVATYPATGYDGLGDSATFTGHYLAALSLKYRNVSDPAVRQQTLASINATLDKIDMLTQVSGKSGYIARHAVPLANAAQATVPGTYLAYYSNYNHFGNRSQVYSTLGPDAFMGTYSGTAYGWLGGTERDTYVGVNYGLATTLAKVDDPGVQSKVRTIIDRVLGDLKSNSWYIRDGQAAGPFGINNLRVPVTTTLKAALLRTAATADPGKYRADYESAAASAPSSNTLSTDSYYSNNLEFASMYALNVLEQKDTATGYDAKWAGRLQNDWQQASNHLNAEFAGVYLAASRNTSDLRALVTLEGELADFPAGPKWARQDLGVTSTATAQHVTVRQPLDFIWQRTSFDIHTMGDRTPLEYPGIDVFLPYWLGVDAGVFVVPEPSIIGLLASGILFLAIYFARRVKRA